MNFLLSKKMCVYKTKLYTRHQSRFFCNFLAFEFFFVTPPPHPLWGLIH